MLGVFCHDFKLYPSLCKNVNLLYISLIFTSVVLFYILTDFRFTNEPLTVVGIWFILALCIFISSGKIPKWLTVLSASSYTIYLFHSTFIGATKAVLTSTVFKSDTSEFASNAMIIFLVLSGVIGPIVLKYCISKFKTKFSWHNMVTLFRTSHKMLKSFETNNHNKNWLCWKKAVILKKI